MAVVAESCDAAWLKNRSLKEIIDLANKNAIEDWQKERSSGS